MKRWRMAAAVAGAVWALGAMAAAQEDESGLDLDSFYGKKSFQEIAVGAAPYVFLEGGFLEEALFGFNTLSRRTQSRRHWKNYYGVSLDFGAGQNIPYPFTYHGRADLNLWYGSLAIESKLFYSDQGRVRPYLGLAGGAGYGAVVLTGLSKDQALKSPSLNLYRFGAEAGVHIMLGDRLALVIADVTSAYLGVIERDQFAVFPSTIYVGLTSWRGVAQERNEEW